MLEDTKSRLAETTKEAADRRTATAKRELGRAMLDVTDEYFAEEVRERRRRDVARGFLVGAAVGVLVRDALGGRTRRPLAARIGRRGE